MIKRLHLPNNEYRKTRKSIFIFELEKRYITFWISIFLFLPSIIFSQTDRWQQRVKYTINIKVDVSTNRFTGKEELQYFNNSPDTINKVFYHLYWNAFQPGSMMDTRNRELEKTGNGDERIGSRILYLKPDEIGYQHISSIKMNGVPQIYTIEETILVVNLSEPILPKSSVIFDIGFDAQVPIQIRRSGRDNPITKVRYSMSQWYPAICEYDYEGWHPTPYVAREFYGVWGDYTVKINIDKTYLIGASGYLQNSKQIGYGYEPKGTKVSRPPGNNMTWIFYEPNVHDFMWAADPEFKHVSKKTRNDLTFHLIYKPTNEADSNWMAILNKAEKALPIIEKICGRYAYKQFSFIHGGDGGMEYPMATLLKQPAGWLHEWLHSWYQGILGTNESMYAWMDEGFVTYYENRIGYHLFSNQDFEPGRFFGLYKTLVNSKEEEPLTTHADHFNTKMAYVEGSYVKGAIFLEQLGYLVGDKVRDKIMLAYYNWWKFKHPNANDFIQVAQKVSGLQLDWYKEYWINTIKVIDYGIASVYEENGVTKVRIRNNGQIPMPIDLMVTFRDSSKELEYIPAYLMFGLKERESFEIPRIIHEPWKWTDPVYTVIIDRKLSEILNVEIDPTHRMADINRKDNFVELK